MSLWTQALQVCLPTVLSLTAFLYAMHFGGKSAPQPKRSRRVLGWVSLALFSLLFALRWAEIGDFPVYGPYSTLSWVALGVLLLHVLTGMAGKEAGVTGLVFGVVAALQLIASCFGPFEPPHDERGASFDIFHVGTSILASSALILSGLHGFLYLLAWRRLRQRKFGPLLKGLPSMEDLARLTRRSALEGFIFLAIGINFGIGWAHVQGVQSFSYSDPWVLAMLVLWLHFGLIAFSGKIPGVTATRASWAAAFGLTFFIAASVATLVPEVSFHWGS